MSSQTNPSIPTKESPAYGGQALIEGVLMRGREAYCVAVRSPDGSVVLDVQSLGWALRGNIGRIPFLRGLVVLWDSLVIGTRALTYSANVQAESEEERIEGSSLALTLLISFAIGVSAFLLLPASLAHLIQDSLGLLPWQANLLEGVVRLGLLIGYIWLIGRSSDIERVFGYHGAEHKTIHAFEAGTGLSPASVASFPREHPRCGTAFLLTVAVFSVLIFSLLGPMPLLPRLMSRVALIPVLASLAYEYIRLTAKVERIAWARPMLWPNLALQRLTTREPDEGMIEVAIQAFQGLRRAEARLSEAKTEG